MNFEESLGEWVLTKYKYDRYKICRDYVKHQVRELDKARGFVTPEEVLNQIAANQIATWKRDGLPAHEGQQLAVFHEVERERRRIERARKGGFAKAKAAKAKKLLAKARKRRKRT